MVVLGQPGQPGVSIGPEGPQSAMVPTESELIEQTFGPTQSTIGGGTGRTFDPVKEQAANDARAAEADRAREAREAAEQKAVDDQAAKRAAELEKALRTRERIRLEAEERGSGFSSREIRQKLESEGTSIGDLRIATRVGRQVSKETGENVFERIREEGIDRSKAQRTDDIIAESFIGDTTQPQKQNDVFEGDLIIPERSNFQKITGFFTRESTDTDKTLDITGLSKSGFDIYKENVVIPLRKTIPTLGDTPIGMVAESIRSDGVKTTLKKGVSKYKENVVIPLSEITPIQSYKENVVIPLSESIPFKAYKERVVEPLSESIPFKAYKERVVEPLSESIPFKAYRENIVVPLSEITPIQSYKENVVIPLSEITPIQSYKENVVVPLREAIPSLGYTPIGQIAEAKRIIESKQPGEKVRLGLPGQQEFVDVGEYQKGGLVQFGKDVFFGEVEKTFTDIAKSDIPTITKTKGYEQRAEIFGKGVSLGSELLSYTIPGVFTGEVITKGAEAQFGKGAFGGPESAVEYIYKNPLEVAAAGLVGGSSIVRKISKGKEIKQAKLYQEYSGYLNKPQSKIVDIERQFKIEGGSEKLYGIEEFKTQQGFFSSLKARGKQKGSVDVQQYKPEDVFIGRVDEITSSGKPGIGKVKLIDDKYTESVVFGGIRRETAIKPSGSGNVKIFKKEKMVAEFPIDRTYFKNMRLDTENIKQSKGFSIGKAREDFQVGGIGDRKKLIGNMDTGQIKQMKDINIKSGKKMGVSQRVEEYSDIVDITKATPKIETTITKTPKVNFISRKLTGQRIEYGKDAVDRTDLTLRKINGDKFKTEIVSQPEIDRAILSRQRQRIVTTFGDDIVPKKQLISKTDMPYDSKTFRNIVDGKAIKVPKSLKGKVIPTKEINIGFKQKIDRPYDPITFRNIGLQKSKGMDLLLKTKDKTKEVLFIEPPQKYLKSFGLSVPTIPITSRVKAPASTSRKSYELLPVISSFRSFNGKKTEASISLDKQSPVLKQDTSSLTMTKTLQESLFGSAMASMSAQIQQQRQERIYQTETKQKTKKTGAVKFKKLMPSSSEYTSPRPGEYKTKFKRKLKLPIIPIPLPKLGFEETPRGRVTGEKEFFRTPSFAAAELGITAPKKLKLEFTGLIERPLL